MDEEDASSVLEEGTKGGPEMIEDDDSPMAVTIHESTENVVMKGIAKQRPEVIEDDNDDPSPDYTTLCHDEEAGNSIVKPAEGLWPGAATRPQLQVKSNTSVPSSTTNQVSGRAVSQQYHPNHELESNQNPSNNINVAQDLLQAQASMLPLVCPTPQSMLPRSSGSSDIETPPVPILFHEVEARVVVEEEPPAPVYPATIIAQEETTWWRMHQRLFMFFGILLLLCIALAVTVTLLLSQARQTPNPTPSNSTPNPTPNHTLNVSLAPEKYFASVTTIFIVTHNLLSTPN